jgi:hypothetical protein
MYVYPPIDTYLDLKEPVCLFADLMLNTPN